MQTESCVMAAKGFLRFDLSWRLKTSLLHSHFRLHQLYKHNLQRGFCNSISNPNRSPGVMPSRVVFSSGVTTQNLSKGITFYVNERTANHVDHDQTKPLLLLLPWLGAKPRAQAKYCEIYFKTGFDVLVVESSIAQFLWPRWGLEHAAHILQLLEGERFSHRPLLVHAFSIGGFMFAQLLTHVAKEPQRYLGITSRIRGQIFDSLVIGSLERMAVGVGKNLFPRFGSLVKNASLLYFRILRRYTVDYFRTGIDVFHNNPLTASALFFFCENDDLCDSEAMEHVQEVWRKQGITVTSKKWVESIHAGHLHAHPQEYLSTLENFLCSINMVPLKAKM